MNDPAIMLLGATGLVGSHALDLLVRDDRFDRIVVPSRRALAGEVDSPKIDLRIVDFDRPETFGSLQGVDAVICALGTTIKKAGSKEGFRKVDFGYCAAAARLARESGASKFIVVTSMGSEARSFLFYSRVKGELEDALKAMAFPYLGIFRPSFLAGERTEHRPGEALGIRLGFLMPKKYKPIHARVVAAAMIDAAASDRSGIEIVESDRLQDFADAHPATAARSGL